MANEHFETIRRLLSEVRDVVDVADDAHRAEQGGVGYFNDGDPTIDDAIKAIGAHKGEIAMFVGAGVSMEAGLPSWNDLLWRLLTELGQEMDDQERAEWIDVTLGEGPLDD